MKRSRLAWVILGAAVSFVQFAQLAAAFPNYQGVDLYTVGMPDGFSSIFPIAEPRDGGQLGGTGTGTITNGRTHALLWSPANPNGIDLNRSGFFGSEVLGTGGLEQFGGARLNSGPALNHAVMWSGTPASAVDLHPASYSQSHLHHGAAGEQVGMGSGGDGRFHAMVWHGTPASAVDLHPAAYISSDLYFTDGQQQVGQVLPTQDASITHAAVWSGTPGSFVDLHPSIYVKSEVRGVANGFQVGWGDDGLSFHALRWNGTPGSAIDLNASFGESSKAFAISSDGLTTVGSFEPQSAFPHAVVWLGNGSQRIDLHTLLPPGFDLSAATWIAADGTIYGTASTMGGPTHVVAWVVPEPSAVAVTISVPIVAMLKRRRRS